MKPMEKNPLEKLAEQLRQPSGFLTPDSQRVKEDIANQVRTTGSFLQLIYNFFVFIFSLFSVPAEVLLRRNFGERYLNFFRLVLGYLLITYYWKVAGWFSGWSSSTSTVARTTWILQNLFILFSLYHILTIALRKWKGIPCHSMYAGDSLPFWRRLPFYDMIGGQDRIQRWGEPVLLLVLSFFIGQLYVALGNFLLFSALSLWAKGYSQHSAFKERILNTIDRQIEAEQLSNALLEWKDPAGLQTDGYVIPAGMAKYSASRRGRSGKAAPQIPPAVKELFVQGRVALANLLLPKELKPAERQDGSQQRESEGEFGDDPGRTAQQTMVGTGAEPPA